MSSTTATLQDIASIEDFLNVAATETVSLFKHLDFKFLLEYDVFTPSNGGKSGATTLAARSSSYEMDSMTGSL